MRVAEKRELETHYPVLMAGHMTKADEKALLSEMIEGCPDGYVKDILQDMRIEIEHAIDSDFGFVSLAERRLESEQHVEDMRKAKETLSVIKAEIREKEEAVKRLDYGLNELRGIVRQLSRY